MQENGELAWGSGRSLVGAQLVYGSGCFVSADESVAEKVELSSEG